MVDLWRVLTITTSNMLIFMGYSTTVHFEIEKTFMFTINWDIVDMFNANDQESVPTCQLFEDANNDKLSLVESKV